MIICIVGPTGVGKTRLSEELSLKYNGIIVNGDAMQVYKEMNIGTAKFTKEEDKGQPHYLFDIAEVSHDYTVYEYQKDVRKVLEDNKDKNVVLVGGSGLYLKAALYNYEFTERETNDFEEYTNEQLYELIKEKGLEEEVHPNNRRRMISRLNSSGNNELKNELLYDDVYFIGLKTDRETLYEKINDRVDIMMKDGLLEEVESLYKKYGMTKSMKTGIGYKELVSYIEGRVTLEEAVDAIKRNSRKYAKRQFTWYNHQMDVTWFSVDYENFSNTVDEVVKYIEKQKNI